MENKQLISENLNIDELIQNNDILIEQVNFFYNI